MSPTHLGITKTNRNAFPNWLTVVPRAGKEEMPPQSISVKHVGAFKVIPPLLSATQDRGIRLFLIGGVGETNNATTATVTAGDLTKEVDVTVKRTDSRLEVNLAPLGLSPGSHRVSVTIGEIEFSFHLRQVEKR